MKYSHGGVWRKFRSVTAWREKLLRRLEPPWLILYLLPDGSRVNRQWLGWVLKSFGLCADTSPH